MWYAFVAADEVASPEDEHSIHTVTRSQPLLQKDHDMQTQAIGHAHPFPFGRVRRVWIHRVGGIEDFSMKSRGILMGFFSFADPHYYVPTELLAKDLSGQTAIVTGATGSFGSVVSEALVKQGAHVVLAIRRL